jgi:hypothetical protein
MHVLLSLDTIANIVNLPYWACTTTHLLPKAPIKVGAKQYRSTELGDRQCSRESKTGHTRSDGL